MTAWMVWGGAAGALSLAFLLWTDRLRLLSSFVGKGQAAAGLKHVGVLLCIAALCAVALGMIGVQWPSEPHPKAGESQSPISLACTAPSSPQKAKAFELACSTSSALPQKPNEGDGKSGEATKMELVFAALGMFISLVTAISLAVAKNAIDEARRAEEKIAAQMQASGAVQEVKKTKMENSLLSIQMMIPVHLTRLEKYESKGINAASLLDQKLKIMEGLFQWQSPRLNAELLSHEIAGLIQIMDNPAYALHLKDFFDKEREGETYKQLIGFLQEPVQGVPHPDRWKVSQSLAQLVRRLEQL